MKKNIFICLLLLVLLIHFNAYALDSALLNMRNNLFEESKELKTLLATSRDAILMNAMWDSCIMAMAQLDAYFYMIGIFNTIKKEDLKPEAVDYLARWLNEIKKTNSLNIKSLRDTSVIIEPQTEVYSRRLTARFGDLNNQISTELKKISAIKKSLK